MAWSRYRKFLPWVIVVLFGLLIRAALMRSLGTLWNDEAFSRHFALMPVGRMLEMLRLDVHPPLHAVLLHFWMMLFGDGTAAIRGMSLVAGAAGLVAFAVLGRTLFDKRTTMLALILAALSPLMVYYGVDGRMYAAVFLLSCLSSLWLWKFAGGDAAAKKPWLYASLALALMHVTGAMVLAAQAVFLLRDPDRRQAFRKLLPGFLFIGFVFSLWFVPLALGRLQTVNQEWQFRSAQEDLGAPQALIYWIWLGKKSSALTLVFILTAFYVLGGLLRRSERRPYFRVPPESEFLLIWFAACFLPFLLFPNVTPRYLAAAIPPFFLLLCHGFLNVAKGHKLALATGAFGVALLAFPGLTAQLTTRSYNWDTTAAWIAERKKPEDRVVFGWYADRMAFEALDDEKLSGLEKDAVGFYPFDDSLDADERLSAHAGTLAIRESDLDRLGPLLDDAPRVFFIPNFYITLTDGGSSSEAIAAWMNEHGWYLKEKLDPEGRTQGAWLLVRK